MCVYLVRRDNPQVIKSPVRIRFRPFLKISIFISTLIIYFSKKIIKIKYILKLHYVINNIVGKIYNNYKFYFE
jgi:hypothetical protein